MPQLSPFVYECLNDISPVYFRNCFTCIENIHQIGTRQTKRDDLFVDHRRTLTVKKANKSDHLADYRDLTFIIDSEETR